MTGDVFDYDKIRAGYRWEVPERYNIAADVCDRHDAGSLAMLHEHFEGAVRGVYWGEMQTLAAQAANLLAGLGVEKGDRVAVVLPPTPETAAVFLGTW
jgi:acetyl-CoA synthetase